MATATEPVDLLSERGFLYWQINGDVTQLARCYFELEKEKVFDRLFWMKPFPAYRTLAPFLEDFSAYSSVVLYKIVNKTDTLGYFTLTDLIVPHHVRIGCIIRRRYWGDIPEDIGRILLPEIHEVLGVERIYAFTPWRTGISLAERLEMRPAGMIEGYAQGRDVHAYVHQR